MLGGMQNGTLPRPGALSPDRRPRASRNIPQVLYLLNVALGCSEPKAALPLPAALERLASNVTDIFADLPSVLRGCVTPESKVGPRYTVQTLRSLGVLTVSFICTYLQCISSHTNVWMP
jgi:hypothetical protein